MKHTPTPWSTDLIGTAGHSPDICVYDIEAQNAKRIATVAGPDAAFIVQACNSHDDLVAALADLQKEIRAHVSFNVKKHYSLMLADVAASKALDRAKVKA